ncbi:ceramide synthase 6-like [Convolutriloba macropyga]|uniref:ceramide synthase 6-like n=1 Tax=Convolutriloba macropyga TaxID=536237 RepID=UPI003F52329A
MLSYYQTFLNSLPSQNREIWVFGLLTIALLAAQWLIELFGSFIASVTLPKKDVKDNIVTNEKQGRKVGESLWRLSFYTSALVYGYVTVSSKDFYSDSSKMWGKIEQDSKGSGKKWIMEPIPLDIHFYYFIELAFYTAATLHHISKTSSAAANKDYWVMLVHHISTIALIASSFYINVYRVGAMVMLLHDWCDPFLEMAKLLKYYKFMDTSLAMFATFGLVFHVTRLYMYPSFVLRSSLTETIPLLPLNPMYLQYYYFANLLLLVILVLNGIWAAFILKGFAKVLFQGGEAHDARSDDENDS